MLNAEKYREEILEYYDKILCTRFGVDKRTKKIIQCCSQECENCEFSVFEEKNKGTPCVKSTFKWLLSEYKESTKVTRLEYELLKYWSSEGYKYIARDRDNTLFIYKDKPSKLAEYWANLYHYSLDDNFRNLFEFVEWEDKEPTSIQEVLGSCEVIEDDL